MEPHPSAFPKQFYCWGSLLGKRSWPQSPAAPVNAVSGRCPPVVLFLSVCGSLFVFSSGVRLGSGCQPVSRPCPPFVLLSCFFSFSSSCYRLVVALSSSGPPVVPLSPLPDGSVAACRHDTVTACARSAVPKRKPCVAPIEGKTKPPSAKTAVPQYGHVAACQHVNITCERALQSSEALAGQLQKATLEADVLSLSCCCPLPAGVSRRKEEAGHSVRPRP